MKTKQTQFTFSAQELLKEIPSFAEKGITEFTLHDPYFTQHKGHLLHFIDVVRQSAPDLFVTIPLHPKMLDMDVCRALSEIFCSLEIPFEGMSKGDNYLFDKKYYANRASTLNNFGMVFGFDMNFASVAGDSVKLFRDRLDFAISLYPNHIDFPQLVHNSGVASPKASATFSTQDIRMTKAVCFACSAFYTYGRAVTWFSSVLKPLKMTPSKFFQDFSEWQKLNNCDLDSGWNCEEASHTEIEKMQLNFLKFKYEEKNRQQLFTVVSDIVRLNGAMARCFGENEETVLNLSYNPEDLLSGASLNIAGFDDNFCMESNKIKVFYGEDGVDYKVL